MKILLIKPPIHSFRVQIGRHAPIGLLYLAGAVRSTGHDVEIFDALAYTAENRVVSAADAGPADLRKIASHPRMRHLVHWGAGWEAMSDAIRRASPDVIGISCMFTPYYETAYRAARLARELVPNAVILLGGSHPTVAYRHAVEEAAFDAIVLGEGERKFLRLLDCLESGVPITSVPGVVARCGPRRCECPAGSTEIHVNDMPDWIDDLESIAPPATDLVDFADYGGSGTLITSRGCPFSCSFCTVHATVGKSFRSRSADSVADEIEHYIRDHGVRRFRIEDDNFTMDRTRVLAICREIQRRDLNVELDLPNGMTVVGLTAELADGMAAAGFRSLFLGLETTDPAHLRKMRKGFTSVDRVQDGIALFEERGVSARTTLIVGLLGQSIRGAAQDVIELARRHIYFGVNPIYPIPSSSDHTEFLRLGLVGADTDLALLEGFNFAIGSNLMSASELYWVWVAAKALSQWPSYILDGARSRAGGALLPTGAGISRLLAEHPVELSEAPIGFETIGAPVPGAEHGVRMDHGYCFCDHQMLRELRTGTGPADFCVVAGDIIAAAVGMHTGTLLAATQTASRVAGAPFCEFRIDSGDDAASAKVHATFCAELTRMAVEQAS
jgi:B12 binding domain/Radical SAM superfamily